VWMQRLNAMMQKLMNRKPTTIVALGDSITFGTGLRDAISDNYVTLFARALSEAFGNAPVRPFRVADPGCRIHEAVAFISTHVTPLHPDLVIIQLGGNDVAMRTDGYVVEQALLNILDMLKRDTNAVVMLLLPPLEDKPRDHTLSRILRAVAVMQKLLFVDWDTILRQVGYDYRGPFAWGAHPNEYAHVIVAKALWKAFWEALAQPPQLTVEIAHQVQYVNAGSEVLIPIVVSNAGDQAIECEVIASIGTAPHSTHRAKLQLDARASHEVMLKWQLPTKLPRQRSYRVPLWTSVRNERDANFDAKWITVCPVLRCSTQPLPLLSPTTDLQRRMDDATPAMGAAEGGAKQLTRRRPMPDELVRPQPHIRLTPKHAVLGWRTLNDLRDLEAIISAHRDKERIHILVQVRDDVVVADAMRKYTENDCIELFLDVRPTARQGIPYYERSVIV
ncbi:MAG TPA: SGNH/GDSL hydrolase family protein, partial [Armatimonadetes bacterium]|nr:SGNH/GDSL hydrolase family protein [Armatimonadota bacterium]